MTLSQSSPPLSLEFLWGGLGCVTIIALLGWLLQPCEWTPPFIPRNPPIDLKACQEKWKKCQSPPTGEAYLVIGAGFLGSRIIEALLQRGESNVTVFDFDVTVKWATDHRVQFIHGDIRSADQINRACSGKQVVYLTAASIRFMDDLDFQWKRSYDVNVVGTKNVVDACIDNEVQYLIQTSTMTVNIPKTHDNSSRLSEDMPYVTRENATSHYATSKAMGEKIVRDANGRNGILKTISLRPGGIFGANDSTMMEIMMKQNMYIFLANFLVDFVFVENVVYAHLLGESMLRSKQSGDGVSGEAFHISNDEPMRNNPFRRMILHYAKIPNAFHGPPRFFLLLAHISQFWRCILKNNMPALGDLDLLTPSAWALMQMDIEMDSAKSKNILKYHPVFTVEEGVQLSVREYHVRQSIIQP